MDEAEWIGAQLAKGRKDLFDPRKADLVLTATAQREMEQALAPAVEVAPAEPTVEAAPEVPEVKAAPEVLGDEPVAERRWRWPWEWRRRWQALAWIACEAAFLLYLSLYVM